MSDPPRDPSQESAPPPEASPPAAPQPAGSLQSPDATDPLVLTIGDIGVTRNWVVTPNGTARLGGSALIARDMAGRESKIPTCAIDLAVIFSLVCLLGLLFLLAKEKY